MTVLVQLVVYPVALVALIGAGWLFDKVLHPPGKRLPDQEFAKRWGRD
ncbi:hypothetical protein [Phytoactinopolyspora limicola]|nr:hypothetical protein [Phytoactinopolyspora limicola]